jgi:hypothetical protein
MRFALLAMLLVACERERPREDAPPAAAETVAAVPATPAPQRCPATGAWSRCAVLERLDRSGLAPRVDSATRAAEPPLTGSGLLVRLGRSELELFFYDNIAARERDEAKLDQARYVVYPAPLPIRPLPTLIRSANLIAILHSRNDHQRERVSDAITAGPPQPSRP